MAKSEDMNYTVEEIAGMCSWIYFQGFCGVVCTGCKRKTNIVTTYTGFLCPCCGTFNKPDASVVWDAPFPKPDFGPPAARIQEGYALYCAGKDAEVTQ